MADTPWPIIPKSQDEADEAESDWDTSEDVGVKWPDNVAELLPEVSYKGETQTFVITRPRIVPDTPWWRCQRAAEIYRRAARQRLSEEWAIHAAEEEEVPMEIIEEVVEQ